MAAPRKVEDAQIVEVLADPTIHNKAEALGIARVSLWERLKRNPKLWDQAYEVVKANVKAELAPIYQALIKKAKSGDVGAANTILKALGELVERVESKSDINLKVEAVISEDDARRLATALLACGKKR